MDQLDNSNRVCIPVEFKSELQYCNIDLNNLTEDTFLLDGKRKVLITDIYGPHYFKSMH